MFKRVVVFDLDGTVIDSGHRNPLNPDGTLNLDEYFKLHNRDNVFRDDLLPLAKYMQIMCMETNYVIVCTARTMAEFDFEYLRFHGLRYHKILHRHADNEYHSKAKDAALKAEWLRKLQNLRQFNRLPWFMFDDAPPVINAMRGINITTINSHKANKKVAKT